MSNILIKYDLCGLSFTRQATPQHFFDHMALRSAAYIWTTAEDIVWKEKVAITFKEKKIINSVTEPFPKHLLDLFLVLGSNFADFPGT